MQDRLEAGRKWSKVLGALGGGMRRPWVQGDGEYRGDVAAVALL